MVIVLVMMVIMTTFVLVSFCQLDTTPCMSGKRGSQLRNSHHQIIYRQVCGTFYLLLTEVRGSRPLWGGTIPGQMIMDCKGKQTEQAMES